MNSAVKTFRIPNPTQRKLAKLRGYVKPTRPGARKASEGDVLREGIDLLYAAMTTSPRSADGGHANRAASQNEVENAQAA